MTLWGCRGHLGWKPAWWLGTPMLLVALLRGPRISEGPPESPEQVAKRQHANGEIDRDMYQQMLADLRGS